MTTAMQSQDRRSRLAADASGSALLPQPLKRILAATDLSARSDRALARAVLLAGKHKAHLTVLHVVDDELPESLRTRLSAAAETEIEACLGKLEARIGAGLSTCVMAGRDYEDILKVAEADACNLIVLGRHRDESAGRPLRGTTMERVIRYGTHPVLVVADRADAPYRSVMVGVDFSIFSRFAVRAALAVAPDAEFRIVHAFQTPFEGFLPGRQTESQVAAEHGDALTRMIEDELESLVGAQLVGSAQSRKIERILRSGEVTSVLRSEASRIEPDLLVIGTHGRVGIAHAVLGSVAENLLNRPPCDVLAVKAW